MPALGFTIRQRPSDATCDKCKAGAMVPGAMKARRAHRSRPETEVAVLDALVERGEEGMTVLELRAAVDADIDAIEEALPALKEDGLISVDTTDGTTTIKPDERVMPRPGEEPDDLTLLDRVRDRLGL